jgi:hypothetical protein
VGHSHLDSGSSNWSGEVDDDTVVGAVVDVVRRATKACAPQSWKGVNDLTNTKKSECNQTRRSDNEDAYLFIFRCCFDGRSSDIVVFLLQHKANENNTRGGKEDEGTEGGDVSKERYSDLGSFSGGFAADVFDANFLFSRSK